MRKLIVTVSVVALVALITSLTGLAALAANQRHRPPPRTTSTVFSTSGTPAQTATNDTAQVNLGMAFTTDRPGYIDGVRFYKAATNTGTHVGDLWSSSGQQLAQVTFAKETTSGWQEADFSIPIAVAANATYVVSYYAPMGNYSYTTGGFSTKVNNAPLQAAASPANGLFVYASRPAFPTATNQADNYFVDVVWANTGPPVTVPGAPTTITASPAHGSALVTWTPGANGGAAITSYTIRPIDAIKGALKPVRVSGDSANHLVTGLTNRDRYTFTVSATNDAGTSRQSAPSNAVTPQASDGSGSSTSSPLLPGEPRWSSGAPSFDFGFNNGVEYSSPGFAELPSVQARVKAAGLTIDRVWAPYEAPPTAKLQPNDVIWLTHHINAAKASGATCYMELGEVDNLPFLEQVVTMAEPMGCHIFEFGNEIDSHSGYHVATYTRQWNRDIPQLRALPVCAGVTPRVSTGCLFGGPTVSDPWYNDSSASNYGSALTYWMVNLNRTNAFPDFVSWHEYPCTNADTWDITTAADQADCISAATLPAAQCVNNVNNCQYSSLPWSQWEVLRWEQQYLGKIIPTGLSETNFDPGTGTLNAWGPDGSFMKKYEMATLHAFVAAHFAFAMEYTSLDYAGYGQLDMFSDSAPYAPKGQFYGFVASIKKYGGP
jgi:hypothetical protein